MVGLKFLYIKLEIPLLGRDFVVSAQSNDLRVGKSVIREIFTPLDNRYRAGDTMKTHKFFKSHATHYNTISNGVN